MGIEVGAYTMVWGHRLRYRIASGVGTGCLTKARGILPTADSDIASGRDLNHKTVSHEISPIAYRRYSIASGDELCSVTWRVFNIADRRYRYRIDGNQNAI